jgi:6-pyruvoyltetrahydropterin/6-carboxytetrahydropterin synthase
MNSMYEIIVKTHFSGAHFLREYKGKCENLHGHNWIVEATVCGENLNSTGLLYDFKSLKKALGEILDELDHTLLNDHPEFKELNPSAERIAKFIHDKLKEHLVESDVQIKEICVHESENSRAVYRES